MNRIDGNGMEPMDLRYGGAVVWMLTTKRPLMPSEKQKHLNCAVLCSAVLLLCCAGSH